jgi:multidrug efflux system membrane fusion protein
VRFARCAAALAALFVLAGTAAGQAAPAAAPVATVEVESARQLIVTPRTWNPGTVVSRDDARIAGVVAGRVLWVAEVGQQLSQGESVARLDDTVTQLRVADLKAQVARTQAQSEYHRAQLARFRSLAATNLSSVSQLDEAGAQLAMDLEDVARLSAQLRQAEYEAEQGDVAAPFPGVVAERFVQRGEYLAAGGAVARLVNTDSVEVRATASLSLAGIVRPGQPVAVRGAGRERKGAVRAAVAVGDERARQFEVRVSLDRSPWPVGAAVEVSLPTGAEHHGVMVPRDAIVQRQGRTVVMRVGADSTVQRIEVETGATFDDTVEVRGAITSGDELVVRGAERIEPGQRVVRVARAAAPSRPQSTTGGSK